MISGTQLDEQKITSLLSAKVALLALDLEVIDLKNTYTQKVFAVQQQLTKSSTLQEQEAISKTIQRIQKDFDNAVSDIKARIRKVQYE